MENKESRFESWMKVMLPVLVPMLLTGCIYLMKVVWTQQDQIQNLTRVNEDQSVLIERYSDQFTGINSDVQELRLDVSNLENKLHTTTQSQEKIIKILEDLGDTLERINVAVGKLETRLDYAEKSRA